MSANKNFKVHFYTARLTRNDAAVKFADVLSGLIGLGKTPLIQVGVSSYELRDLQESPTKQVYQGVFAKIRTDDAPHIREDDGQERDIELNDGEGLLEKNHFLFYRKFNLLVYQANGHGSRVGRLQDYLSEFLQGVALLDPVLQPDAMKRLMKDQDHVLKTELTFSTPTNNNWYPSDKFTRGIFDMMSAGGGAALKMTVYGRRAGQRRGYLKPAIKGALRELTDHEDVRKARVYFESDHGDRHDIDLVADRITSDKSVAMDGRYPNSRAMYKALREAYSDHQKLFSELFSADDTSGAN